MWMQPWSRLSKYIYSQTKVSLYRFKVLICIFISADATFPILFQYLLFIQYQFSAFLCLCAYVLGIGIINQNVSCVKL